MVGGFFQVKSGVGDFKVGSFLMDSGSEEEASGCMYHGFHCDFLADFWLVF